ncbi:restriction endonuclease [Acinetobacter proteolyticus]|uniref:Restriction endonuclease n=1 Tax=Acinetobacter proteolyticus TaxID=1776741 RepID=A0A2N0WK88_9GAMM|nr:restriction endonuclease [Acinetobacter proteolyticus]PKF36843.1 restriction endonuclease [Acinetobacter proteolyticus]
MFNKDINALEATAIKWWSSEIKETVQNISIIPRLINSHDQFISILKLTDPTNPRTIFDLIRASNFAANVFIKHLSILTDFGGELLKRLSNTFEDIFFRDDDSRLFFKYTFEEKEYQYYFNSQTLKGLSNTKLKIDGASFSADYPLNGIYEDIIMILMFGAFSGNDIFLECDIANRIRDTNALDVFLKQRYIYVSKITSGARSNSNGQVLQKKIQSLLQESLGNQFIVQSNGKINLQSELIEYLNFDIVVSKIGTNSKIGLEISFQVTTNSVIERKAVSAQTRQTLMHNDGHHIGYIIDGAGNFERRSAVSIICSYSDCTVNCSQSDLLQLVAWIEQTLV